MSPLAPVAQPVEHLTFNQGVRSSILRRSTKAKSHPIGWLFALALCLERLCSRSDGVRIPPKAVSCQRGERVKTIDNRFREAKSAKAEENQEECTEATIFDQRRGLENRYKLYKRLTNAACGILAQCCKRELRKPPSISPFYPTRQILRMFSHPIGWLFALALCPKRPRSRG